MFKPDLEKAEEPEIKLPTAAGSSKKQSSRKTSTSTLLTMPQSLTVWITTNCGKFFTRWKYQTTLPASGEICMQIKKQKLELNMGQQFSLVTQLCLTLCDPMDYSTTGFPDHHQLPKLTQTHVHRVSDAIQPSHPLSSPSPPAFILSQPSGSYQVSQVFTSGGQSIAVSASTSVRPMNIRTDFLQDGLIWFPYCQRDSQESSPPPQFKRINSLALNFLYSPTLTSIQDY